MTTPIEKAVEIAGGQAALAAKLSTTSQVVQHWRKRRIPAERVLQIEAVTGIPRHELRPDLYPVEA